MPACLRLLLLCAFAPLRDIPSPDLGSYAQALFARAIIGAAVPGFLGSGVL
jgi:hypothetical protein